MIAEETRFAAAMPCDEARDIARSLCRWMCRFPYIVAVRGVQRNFVTQRADGDAEQRGGMGAVAAGFPQRGEDQLAFDIGNWQADELIHDGLNSIGRSHGHGPFQAPRL